MTTLDIRRILEQHWVTAVECNEDEHTDTVRCSCSVWTGTPQLSIGSAVREWASHVATLINQARVMRTGTPKQKRHCLECGEDYADLIHLHLSELP